MTTITRPRRPLIPAITPAFACLTLFHLALVAAEEVRAQERGVGVAVLIGVGARQEAAGFGTVAGEVGLERGRWEVRATAGYQRFLDPECPAPPPVVSCDNGGTLAVDLIGGIRPGPAGGRHWSVGIGPGVLTSGSVPYVTGLVSWETGMGARVGFRVEARGRALVKNGTHAELLVLLGVGIR